jgi:glycosyltransferase involved in cell wall biosynthesis
MISNCAVDDVAVIEITNELPLNRLGGVGSAIDGLSSGFQALGLPVLWFLIDHHYQPAEIDRILGGFANVAIGSMEDLRTIRAPTVHLHTYNHNPAILDYLQGRKTIFTIHSLLRCEAEFNDIDLSWAIERQERLIAGCDEIVLVSQAELGHYRRLGYLELNDRVHVIHNGLRHPAPCARSIESRKIGFCGRLVPRKRPEYAQWILKEEGFEAHSSLIAGRGFSAYARDLMADAELRHRVRYLGWCGSERLEAFYRQIDLLVIPSAYEPFGMVALEAMSRGIPVVCTRIDGLVEVLGDEAIYAEDNSYACFRQAMWRWLRQDKLGLDAMAKRAHERFCKRFTDVIAAGNYGSLFARLG